MKIFNWVHRRFTHKEGFSQNVKKVDRDDIFTKDGDTQALLDNVVHLADFLDGWQGGVLAIGTFGLGSLLKQENQYYCEQEDPLFEVDVDDDVEEEEEEEEVYNEEGEELNPLVVMNKVEEEGSKCDPAAAGAGAVVSRGSMMISNGGPVDDAAGDINSDGYSPNKWDCHYNMMMRMMLKNKKNKNKKERITLADLFSAELGEGIIVKTSKKGKLMEPAADCVLMRKKKVMMQDNAGKEVFPKKLNNIAAGVKDDSSPLKKLNQLMKKMLKRKIHPDAEPRSSSSSSITSTTTTTTTTSSKESDSLLQHPRYEIM